MKASEVLKKPGDVAVNGRGEVKVCTNSDGDDWEPLLTREEWKAAHLEEAAAEWERNCWHRPAPNPVGERVEPEDMVEGEWYVGYTDGERGPIIESFRGVQGVRDNWRVYRWHGEVPPAEPVEPKPALEYPERLKVPGVAGVFKSEDGDWYATTEPSRHINCLWGLGPVLFPEIYQPPYSDVEAKDSWIDNPAYEGGEA